MGTDVCRGGATSRRETGQRDVAGSEMTGELVAKKTRDWQKVNGMWGAWHSSFFGVSFSKIHLIQSLITDFEMWSGEKNQSSRESTLRTVKPWVLKKSALQNVALMSGFHTFQTDRDEMEHLQQSYNRHTAVTDCNKSAAFIGIDFKWDSGLIGTGNVCVRSAN